MDLMIDKRKTTFSYMSYECKIVKRKFMGDKYTVGIIKSKDADVDSTNIELKTEFKVNEQKDCIEICCDSVVSQTIMKKEMRKAIVG